MPNYGLLVFTLMLRIIWTKPEARMITDEQKLLEHILLDYDSASRPVFNAAQIVEVKFGITLTQISDMVSTILIIMNYYFVANKTRIPDEHRLLLNVLKDYDTAARPVYNASDNVTVKFGFTLTQIADMVSLLIIVVKHKSSINLVCLKTCRLVIFLFHRN